MIVFLMRLRARLRRVLTPGQLRSLADVVAAVLWAVRSDNLIVLGVLFGTDKQGLPGKSGDHQYLQHYQRHFGPLHRRRLSLLEIGIGGYDDPAKGGDSLRMWKAYFRRGSIAGLDIADKSVHQESRIRTFQGSQADPDFLRRVVAEMGGVDIVIDDGSHLNAHVVTSFEALFPLLAPNGVYVVEDTQTSYWSADEVPGGAWDGSGDLSAAHTSMSYFKALADGLNFEEFPAQGYEPNYVDRHVVAVHFYHNLVFIMKGTNDEGGSPLLGRSRAS